MYVGTGHWSIPYHRSRYPATHQDGGRFNGAEVEPGLSVSNQRSVENTIGWKRKKKEKVKVKVNAKSNVYDISKKEV